MGIIAWIVFGFIVGLIARAIVPGRQNIGLVLTTVLGVCGSSAGSLPRHSAAETRPVSRARESSAASSARWCSS